MGIVDWDDMYATGIPIVDDQHKALFRTINELHEGLALGKGKQEVARTLDSRELRPRPLPDGRGVHAEAPV